MPEKIYPETYVNIYQMEGRPGRAPESGENASGAVDGDCGADGL